MAALRPETGLVPRLLSSRGRHEAREWTQQNLKKAIAFSRSAPPNNYVSELMAEARVDEETWKSRYAKSFKAFKDSVSRDFVFRYMHGAVYTNNQLHKFNSERTPSPKCTYCEEPVQTRRHLFRECPFVQGLKRDVENRIFRDTLSPEEWLMGSEDEAVNLVVWFFLKYVYFSNFHGKTPTLAGLEGQIKEMKVIEREIAQKNQRWGGFYAKWNRVDDLMTMGKTARQ